MRNISAYLGLLAGIGPLSGQNLVPNPSFEEVTSCPTFASQLELAAPWTNPNLGTPELYHGCAPLASYVSVPYNTTGGYQYARTGLGYAGIFCWRTDIANMREYAQVELTEPLLAGNCYRVRFHVNMPNDHPFATDGIGAHVSVGPVLGTAGQVLQVIPQITNSPGNLITDTLGWTEISEVFTANGGETHLTIGNFWNDANTQTVQVNTGVWYETSAYLLVDDVSVEALELDFDLGPDTLLCASDIMTLDASTPEATYLWDDGSTSAVRTVNMAGTYWVTVTVAGCSVSDTLVVTMKPMPQVSLPPDTALCPSASLVLDVSDAAGEILWWDGAIDSVRVVDAPGTYWVSATNECGSSTASMAITMDICPCVPYLPNAFSPNGDGINDMVSPAFQCDQGELRWSVYDRWGFLLFEGSGAASTWDGTFSGQPVASGIYVCRAHIQGAGKENEVFMGHISVLR